MRYCLVNDTRFEHHYGCLFATENIIEQMTDIGCKLYSSWGLGDSITLDDFYKKNKSHVQLWVINAEGTLHSSNRSCIQIVELISKARAFGSVVIVINGTWFNNTKELTSKLQEASILAFRDGESTRPFFGAMSLPDFASKELINRRLLKSANNLIFVTDSILYEDTMRMKEFAVSINALPLSIEYGTGFFYWRHNAKRFGKKRIIYKPIRFLKFLLASYFFSKGRVFSADLFVKKVASAALIVTGRYHVVVVCLALRIPFIAIDSNTPKINYLLDDVGLLDRLVDKEKLFSSSFEHSSYIGFNEAENKKIDMYFKHGNQSFKKLNIDMKNAIYKF